MTTQYTPTLKLALPVTGELSGTWGDIVNDNITSMIEQAIAGLSTINTWTANSHTLTTANGTTSESRCAMLVAATGGGAPTAAADIICPSAAKLYVLQNNTSFAVTLKTSAGTGVAVAAGDTAFLFCDGTNVNSCVTTIVNGNITGNLTVGGNATINGNTTLGNATSDTITATARFNTDLLPSTDNARDLGSAANAWKDLYIDGTATIATLNVTTIDTTNLEVTNIKAKDGTAALQIADVTGVVSVTAAPVLTALTASQAVFTNGSKALVSNAITGTGNVVMSTSATLVTPALGTPSALVGTNITGTAAGLTAGNVTTNANLTGAVTSVGNATSLGSFTSAQLATALTDETGTGSAVFATSPTLVTPALGTPSALVGTNITGTAAGLTAGNVTTNANLTGAVTSVGNATSLGSFTSAQLATALTDETGTGANVFATSPTLVTPNLGTPSTLVGTNITGTAAGLTAGNVSTNANLTGAVTSVGNATSLGSFTSAQLATALTDETGTGSAVFATSPTLVTPALGTPSSGTVTNLTGTASININGTVGATTPAAGAFTTIAASGTTTLSGNQIISVTDNTNAALRITQLGTGNALLVEDSANPDASPFIIDNTGDVLIGTTSLRAVGNGFQTATNAQIFNELSSGDLACFTSVLNRNDTNGPCLILGKSRGTTSGSVTVVQLNDNLGQIRFAGADGTTINPYGASIEGTVDGTPGLNDMPGRLAFNTTADGASTPTERMRIDSVGAVGISATPSAGDTLRINKTITGATTSYGVYATGTIQSGVTTLAVNYASTPSTAAAAFTLGNLRHFVADQGTFGASSAVTNQHGFFVGLSLTGATNNYGFYSNIAAAANRFNFYANGTADNYFAGSVGIGAVPTSAAKTNITSTSAGASTIALSLQNASNTVSSETVLDFVTNNSGAGVRSAQITAINTNGSTGVNMLFKIGNGAVATEAMRLDSNGTFIVSRGAVVGYQPSPAGISAAATLTNDNIQKQIISATGTTYTITMPLGTTLETLISWTAVDLGYDFSVINTATGIITMAVNTGVTSLGLLTIAAATSAQFRIRRTVANTFILYRLA